MNIQYPSGSKSFNVVSPFSKKNVKRLARRSFYSLASSMATSSHTSNQVLEQLCRTIRHEIKKISSKNHDSILRDSCEGVKYFNWDTAYTELAREMPTLMKILTTILGGKESQKKVLMCLICSMVLKSRVRQMSLVQRAISVFLYGNGCTKEV